MVLAHVASSQAMISRRRSCESRRSSGAAIATSGMSTTSTVLRMSLSMEL